MSIATLKLLESSERFMLVRVGFSVVLPSSQWVPFEISPGVYGYETYFPFFPYMCKKHVSTFGVTTLTLTTSWTNPPLNTYIYNSDTKILRVNTVFSGLSLIASGYKFLTGNRDRYAPATPTNGATPTVLWESKLAEYPSCGMSIEDALAGVISLTGTSVNIINDGGSFSSLITPLTSPLNQSIDVWLCINDVSFAQLIFTGTITSISLDSTNVTLSAMELMSRLNAPAYMGRPTTDRVYTTGSYGGQGYTMGPSDVGRAKRYIFMGLTPEKYTRYLSTDLFADNDDFFEAVNISYGGPTPSSGNRTWHLGRIVGQPKTQSFGGAVVRGVLTGEPVPRVLIQATGAGSNSLGQTVRWTISGTPYYGIVTGFGGFSFSGNFYNLQIRPIGGQFGGGVVCNNSAVITALPIVKVFIKDGVDTLPLAQGRDYVLTILAVTGTDYFDLFMGLNSIEQSFYQTSFPQGFLDPNSDKPYFTLETVAGDFSEAQIIQRFLNSEGIPWNPARFLPKGSVALAVPDFGSTTADNYLAVLEKLLTGRGLYLTVNNAGQVEMDQFKPPVGTLEIDNNTLIDSGISIEVNYQDIVSELEIVTMVGTTRYVEVQSDYLSGELNTLKNSRTMETYHSPAHPSLLIQLAADRRAKYTFETATLNVQSRLGDDIILRSDRILGGAGVDHLKIVSLSFTASSTTISAMDFDKLT